MTAVGIDPGSTESGIVRVRFGFGNPVEIDHASWEKNELVLQRIVELATDIVCIEHVRGYGRKGMSNEIRDTTVWVGRFCQKAVDLSFGVAPDWKCQVELYFRTDIVRGFAGHGASETATKEALKDKYGPWRKKGEPLYPLRGNEGHCWPAFAVAAHHWELTCTMAMEECS